MPSSIDNYLGVHAAALKLRSQRTEVLAANLANADTPGYRARDIDFKQRARCGQWPGRWRASLDDQALVTSVLRPLTARRRRN